MGICIIPVSQLLEFIFNKDPSLQKYSIEQQYSALERQKKNIDEHIYKKIIKYKREELDSMIRIRAEDAMELQEQVHQEE